MDNEFEKDSFTPHPLLPGGHLQTVVPSYLKRPLPPVWNRVREQVVTLEDQSELAFRYLLQDPKAPTMMVLHGMGGSSRSRYVIGLLTRASVLGWNFIAPSLYDVSAAPRKPTVFHSGCSSQVFEFLTKVRTLLRLNRFLLSGVSMGGNILLKLVGEWESSVPEWVEGAAVISPLNDLSESAVKMENYATIFYRRWFVRKLQRTMFREDSRYREYVDLEQVFQARSIREFDQAFTVPLCGFASPDDYYRTQSARQWLGGIRVPTYILHSLDDPILTSGALQSPAVQENSSITLCLTRRGGHVGFFSSGPPEDRYWAEARIIEFFRMVTESADNKG